ncbi:MAG: hypothetical protein NZM31_04420, partial [Gemmatales bacterium]|nr:hypothetical protein [Gemmatales bacterium]MDW8386246.1 hypothetical protein [Gemmatales bacterium]
IDSYKRLRFYFRQRSATDVVLHRLELYTSDDRREPPQIIEVESKEDEPEQVARIPLEQGTSLEVRVQPYSSAEDFRLTGRIHLKKPAIDDVEA